MSTAMASIAPIRLYGHQAAPNPWKVVIICNELAIPFEHVYTPFQDMKKPPFLKLNPNGRVPVIEDPNTGTTVWESGAIIEYLIDTYDTKGTLTYTKNPQKWSLRSWEHFQLTVQDQYFGQKAYFALFHKNKDIPTVIEYFGTEVKRALGVIDLHLARTGQQYLVGEKCTFVDLMYLPFNVILSSVLLHKDFDQEWKREMPHCHTWHQLLMQRKSVQDALKMKAQAEQEMGLQGKGQTMPPISYPIPVVLCGKSTEIGKPVSELLLPEYEVIYFIQSFEAAKKELPHLIAGREPQSSFPNEVGTHKYGRPARAVILGRAFEPSQVEQLVHMCAGPETVAWIAGDPAKRSDSPPGPNYANVASREAKDALGKWVSEGCIKTETILY